MALITLKEYAIRNGKDPGNMSKKFKHGDFTTAVKIGRVILIDEDEPLSDRRLKNGRWIDYRKNLEAGRKRKAQKFLGLSENVESDESTEARP